MTYAVHGFTIHPTPHARGAVAVLASFTLWTGIVRLPGFGLALGDNGQVFLLKPRSPDRAYRLQFANREIAENVLDTACDTYERLTGHAPEDADIPAVVPPATANAYQQDEQLHDHARDSSPPGRDQDRAADAAHRGREQGAGR